MTISNVKTDITFKADGTIELSAKVSTMLGIEQGDHIAIRKHKEEVLLYIFAKSSGLSCKGRCRQPRKNSRFMRVSWKELCDTIIQEDGRAPEAQYRVGDPINLEGETYLPIITRRNYAASGN